MTDRPLNLLLLISELDVGGAEKNFVSLATGLQNRGHRVTALSLDARPEPGKDAMVTALEQHGVGVRFGSRTGPWPSPLCQVSWVQQQILELAPDLLYSMLFRANWAAVLACRRLARSTTEPTPPPPLVVGFRQAEPRRWVQAIERYCLRNARAGIAVSQQVAQHYERSSLHERSWNDRTQTTLKVIKNAVVIPVLRTPAPSTTVATAESANNAGGNSPLARPAELHWPYLLYLGRLTPQKGLNSLLQYANEFLPLLPEHHLVLVGGGDQRSHLERLAKSLVVSDRIHFVGWQAQPEHYIAHCDALVLNSRWEGLPNVVLEAMSFAKPVVTVQTHGIDDIFGVEQPRTFNTTSDVTFPINAIEARALQVVPVGERRCFVDAVRRLVTDRDLAEAVGNWNREHVRREFSRERFLDRHEQFFLSVLRG